MSQSKNKYWTISGWFSQAPYRLAVIGDRVAIIRAEFQYPFTGVIVGQGNDPLGPEDSFHGRINDKFGMADISSGHFGASEIKFEKKYLDRTDTIKYRLRMVQSTHPNIPPKFVGGYSGLIVGTGMAFCSLVPCDEELWNPNKQLIDDTLAFIKGVKW